MNEALGAYGWSVKEKGDDWIVSDGKIRLLRFYDGMVIEGGVAPSPAPGPVASSNKWSAGAKRFAPY